MMTPSNRQKKVLTLDDTKSARHNIPLPYDLLKPLSIQVFEVAYRITQRLQATLDLEKIIALFCEQVKKVITFDGFSYCHQGESLDIVVSADGKYRVSYHLAIDQETLGDITFIRDVSFSQEDINILENLLVPLLYPLRNALHYRKAINNALRDPLTGVGNRLAMNNTLYGDVEFAKRHGFPLSLLIIDVDQFKSINDTYGHGAGDYTIQQIASAISTTIRCSDKVFRYGGDEFVVILGKMDQCGAHQLANRARELIEQTPYHYDNREISCTISIGIASLKEDDNDNQLLKRADQALLLAKEMGRNHVCFGT